MRKPLMAGNWKMYKTVSDVPAFFETFSPLTANTAGVDVVVCPSFVNLAAAAEAAKGSLVEIGAQDIYWGAEGAFTGEVSGPMLLAVGARWVLVGHSERRQFCGETDETVLRRTLAALDAGLKPIICVGEHLRQREAGETERVLEEQFHIGISSLSTEQFKNVVIAYEPVWAIGTGKTATPELAQAAHRHLRKTARNSFGDELAASVRILYGGSVKPDNVKSLMAQPDIDGTLVGGASLEPKSFASIVNFA